VGIPIAWNNTVRKKTEAWHAAAPDREPEWLQLQREHEQIAIQVSGLSGLQILSAEEKQYFGLFGSCALHGVW
jgi:hypothetical protein